MRAGLVHPFVVEWEKRHETRLQLVGGAGASMPKCIPWRPEVL
jgi:hypothetical protein